jgi:hypothetical protein
LFDKIKIQTLIFKIILFFNQNTTFETLKKRLEKHNLINSTHETQTGILENDFKILEQIDKKQEKLLHLIKSFISNSSFWQASFRKLSAIEVLAGIKITEKVVNGNLNSNFIKESKIISYSEQIIQTLLSYYNVLFLQIIDQCFAPENDSIRVITSKFSNELSNRCQSSAKVKINKK